MIKWETRVLLLHYLEQGLSKAAIARHVGIDRPTVYRWIEAGELDPDPETGLLPTFRRHDGVQGVAGFKSGRPD